MNQYDRITSLIWLGLAVCICVESVRLPLGSFQDPGPGFLPLLCGLILAGLSLICFKAAGTAEPVDENASWYSRERWKSVVWVLLALFAYVVAMESLGFLLTTFLFLAFLFRFGMEPMSWMWAAGGSAAASLCCYGIFELWLQTQLPKGILGF